MSIRYKQDPIVSQILDYLADIPTNYKLKHNKNSSKNEKRKIRKIFNNIKPEIDSKAKELLFFGETKI